MRGLAAFISGGFDGYQFGEAVRDRRRQAERQERLDGISEEQRAIDNRRNDLRDNILQDDHSYTQAERARMQEQREWEQSLYESAAAATDAAMGDQPAAQPTDPVLTGGGGTSSVTGGPGDDRIQSRSTYDLMPFASEMPAREEPRRRLSADSLRMLEGGNDAQRRRLALTGPAGGPAPSPAPQAPAGGDDRMMRAILGNGAATAYQQQQPTPQRAPSRREIDPRLLDQFRQTGPAGAPMPMPTPRPASATEGPKPNPRAAFGLGNLNAPPSAGQDTGQPAPGEAPRSPVVDTLEQSGSPAAQDLGRVIHRQGTHEERMGNEGGRRRLPSVADAERERDGAVRTWVEQYAETGAPMVQEQLLRRGMVEEAAVWDTWIQSQEIRAGMELYGQAAWAAARGDMDTFADSIFDLYEDENYFPDGIGVDREASEFIRDPDTNDIVGAQVTFVGPDGQRFVETWNSMDQLVEDVLTRVAPERAFELRLNRMGLAAEAARETAEETAAQAQEQRERVSKIVESLAEENLGVWATMTPEEQQAMVRQRMALEDQMAAAATGGGQQGAAMAPPPMWRG
jgi:hypothetical protein